MPCPSQLTCPAPFQPHCSDSPFPMQHPGEQRSPSTQDTQPSARAALTTEPSLLPKIPLQAMTLLQQAAFSAHQLQHRLTAASARLEPSWRLLFPLSGNGGGSSAPGTSAKSRSNSCMFSSMSHPHPELSASP